MGMWKNLAKGVTQHVMDETYESRRSEVPLDVQYVTDRALVLVREGRLTSKKIGNLAGWDTEILRWIGRDRGVLLPGIPDEQKAINKAAKVALRDAVDREASATGRKPAETAKAKHPKKPKPGMTRTPYDPTRNNDALWSSHLDALAKALRRLEHHDFVVVAQRSDPSRYVQFVRDGPILVGECSGADVDGGPAALSPGDQDALLEMGWGMPSRGPADTPNFRVIWQPSGSQSTAFLRKVDARAAAEFAVSTLRGPLHVDHASDVEMDLGAM